MMSPMISPQGRGGFALAALLALAAFQHRVAAVDEPKEINIDSLLREMIDRDAFTRAPAVAWTCRQASSYDRRSSAPDKPGWFANQDWSQFVRIEARSGRTERVLMDVDGPGCIVRFWTGAPTPEGALTDKIRIYLDGSADPVIEETVDGLCGGAGRIPPPLSAVRCIGRNLYFPIPYARHIKVTYDGAQNCWYNINYRTYPAGTRVRSFDWSDFDQARPLLDRVGRTLLAPQGSVVAESTLAPVESDLGPGAVLRQRLAGSRVIRSLAVQLHASDLAQSLRSTVVAIRFDGEQTVWCPVGDFFGSGVGLNPYRDWWRDVDRSGLMTCWWPMPFKSSCEIEIRNLGTQPVHVTLGAIGSGGWKWDARSRHFHATWRQQAAMSTKKEDGFDWNYLEAAGDGVYVGDTLALFNGAGPWWGEGDEKIWVDGESFPSHFGTGTEDYYGFSFGDRGEFFEAPFHAEPRWEGNNKSGFVTVTRSRALDAIPFSRSLSFDMEVWHWSATKVSFAATTYWYARPGADSNRRPQPEEAARPVTDLDSRIKGVVEGETTPVLERTGGVTETQTGDPRWNGSQQLWWRDPHPGDRLTLAFPLSSSGRHHIALHATLARDYGVFQFLLDGKKIGDPVDFYAPEVDCRTIDLGDFDLPAGRHSFTAEVIGANPAAEKRHMLGVDFLRATPP
jgi:Protein of unknown function (DUF2961)